MVTGEPENAIWLFFGISKIYCCDLSELALGKDANCWGENYIFEGYELSRSKERPGYFSKMSLYFHFISSLANTLTWKLLRSRNINSQ